MVAYNKINSFTTSLGSKAHNLTSDALTIALTKTTQPPLATNTLLTNLTEIAYTNLTARVPTITSFTNSATTMAKLILADLTITCQTTTAPAFGCIALYNDTATNDPLICWWEYGSDVTLAPTETFTIDFDGSGGVLTIA